jgi:hypothetical protein
MQRPWAPAARFIVGAGALSIAALGAQRRDMPGWLMMLGGLGVFARAAANLEATPLGHPGYSGKPGNLVYPL